MTAVLAGMAQVLHIALLLSAAPMLMGFERAATAVLSGAAMPSPLVPWRDLARLGRKQPSTVETASWLCRAAPSAGFACTLLAAALVPTFSLGLLLAPWADLLTITGLLLLARLAGLLAALDPGSGRAGMAVAQRARQGVLAETVILLVVMALALLAASTNLDQIGVLQVEAAFAPHVAAALGFVALLAVAVTDTAGDDAALTLEAAGRDLAVLRMTEALRRLTWLNLALLAFLPIGLAPPDGGILAWGIGLVVWIVRLAAVVLVLAVLRAVVGRMPARWTAGVLSLAGLLGALAVVLALSRAGAA
ncbi:MAG: NADH-quinone oxidoreductase subunit H [Acetobacteraceae bacterium]